MTCEPVWWFVDVHPLQVCTAQYFVWYFSLLPLVLPLMRWPPSRGLMLAAGWWVLAQLHWLAWGYLLEFQVRYWYGPTVSCPRAVLACS